MLNKATQYLDLLPPTTELEKIQTLLNGYKQFQLLKAGYDTKIFDWLAKHGPASKADIAASLELRGAHLSAFLQALCELDCLTIKDDLYAVNANMGSVLLTESAWCQADSVDQLQVSQNRWTQLSDFMMETQHKNPGPVYSVSADVSLYLHPMRDEAKQIANRILQTENITAWRNLLCFDGCNGLVAIFICEKLPHLKATIVVPEAMLASTKKFLSDSSAQDRCQLVVGSPLSLEVVERYDMVLACHSLYPDRKHLNDALENMLKGLNEGGTFLAAHWFCLEACDPSPYGLLEMDKAILTDSHPLCGVERFPQRLIDLGLVATNREDLTSPYGITKLHYGRERHAK